MSGGGGRFSIEGSEWHGGATECCVALVPVVGSMAWRCQPNPVACASRAVALSAASVHRDAAPAGGQEGAAPSDDGGAVPEHAAGEARDPAQQGGQRQTAASPPTAMK